jgi:alcohol dehydrogenase (cytochrome c)
LNLVYWGIGNPGPDWNADSRTGDNLYTCSLVALDGDTGALKWHFQFTPHDTTIDRLTPLRPRSADKAKLVAVANRNILLRPTGRVRIITARATPRRGLKAWTTADARW